MDGWMGFIFKLGILKKNNSIIIAAFMTEFLVRGKPIEIKAHYLSLSCR
jgi:hypothetical protein